jgi:hypothetical protein
MVDKLKKAINLVIESEDQLTRHRKRVLARYRMDRMDESVKQELEQDLNKFLNKYRAKLQI